MSRTICPNCNKDLGEAIASEMSLYMHLQECPVRELRKRVDALEVTVGMLTRDALEKEKNTP